MGTSHSRTEQMVLMQKLWHVTILPYSELPDTTEREQSVALSDTLVFASKQNLQFDNFLVNLICQEATCVLFSEEQEGSYFLKHEFLENLSILSLRLQLKDRDLYQHSLRVLSVTRHFLQALHLPQEVSTLIQIAAFFHDVGKIDIPNEILQKSSRLTSQEFEEVKKHSFHGAQRLGRNKLLEEAANMVLHNHEHWDGSGYPDGLQGQEIPLGSRIISLADSFTVMTTGRAYKAPCTPAQALVELSHCAGTQFDPLLVDHFCHNMEIDSPQRATQMPVSCEVQSSASYRISEQTH